MTIQTKFTTRSDGDMRKIAHTDIILAEQIHGSDVAVVTVKDVGKIIPGVDGLVTSQVVRLGIRVADCVPILAYDERSGITGVAHAGWRGTLGNIAGALIASMLDLGAQKTKIRVSLGPHIGMCCYDVPKDRVKNFLKIFKESETIVSFFQNTWHLDIGRANFLQLTLAGVIPSHIEAPVLCTSCQNDKYFSYRKDTKETFGEMMGTISYIG